jgi:hypothetical protein
VVDAKASQTGATGTVTLEITDPMARVTATAFEPSAGGGAFDLSTDPATWAVYDTTDPYTLTDDVTLTSKHTSRIAWAVEYSDPDGISQWFRGVETFDLDLIAEVTNITVDFNADGDAVVSTTGDEDTANMYVTVGDGSAPSDPTVSVNDGSISGRNGTVDTGVKIATGNEAYVKVVAADSGGTLGPVQSARQARRLGVAHLDTSSRFTTSATETTLETVTIPAGVLGLDGAARLTVLANVANTNDNATIRVRYEGTLIIAETFTPLSGGLMSIDVWLINRGSASSQRVAGRALKNVTAYVRHDYDDTTENTALATDLTVQCDHDLTDRVTLILTSLEFLGAA